jgi:hypothetical protein
MKTHVDKYSNQRGQWKIVKHGGKIWIEDQYIFELCEARRYEWNTCNKDGKCNQVNGWFVHYYETVEDADEARKNFKAYNEYEEL